MARPKKARDNIVVISGNGFKENGVSSIEGQVQRINLIPIADVDRDLRNAEAVLRRGDKWFLLLRSGKQLPLEKSSQSSPSVWMQFYLNTPSGRVARRFLNRLVKLGRLK